MEITRRKFIKLGGLGVAAVVLADIGCTQSRSVQTETQPPPPLKTESNKEARTICCFCSVGCGMITSVSNGKVTNLEGDPDHPISRGALCSKAAGLSFLPNSPQRITKPMYRAPFSNEWKEVDWDFAYSRMVKKIKTVRDENWIENENIGGTDYRASRCDALAFYGGAANTNEECYLYGKMARLLGVVQLEHQARICHSSTVAALAPSFGRGAMTNHWNDIQHAKVILIQGSNAAENHPVSMKWVDKAKENGATVIHVDPRYTRTSSQADIFAQVRPGTDIAVFGAIINHVLREGLYDEFYLKHFSNASFRIKKDFSFHEGLFSGYDSDKKIYDKSSWGYAVLEDGKPAKASDLNEPDTVFSYLKKHYARYDFETSSKITGIPVAKLKKIAGVFANNHPGTVMYALGLTQHTTGVQNIRSLVVMQLLLGNIGVSGGGINALRGHSNVQGSTDMCLLFHILPGYLASPTHKQPTIDDWNNSNGKFKGKFLVNLLKAWFGENATKENGYLYKHLPLRNGMQNYSAVRLFENMLDDKIKYFHVMGQNPMVTNPNINAVREGLSKLDMLVCQELFESETSAFWKSPGTDPSQIATEVLLLPAASFVEKEGTITNSGRWIQWRQKAIDPIGMAKNDCEIIDTIFTRLREEYKQSPNPANQDPVLKADWNYNLSYIYEDVLKEINGYDLKTGRPVKGIGSLKDDGTTSAGEWIYSGCFSEGHNLTKRQNDKYDPEKMGLYPKWAFSWPGNVRVLYNRASCDLEGKPRDPERALVWWDKAAGKWTGVDKPDVKGITSEPSSEKGRVAFKMTAEGSGRIFTAPYASKKDDAVWAKSGANLDGPIPEFYEPVESPADNILHPKVSTNPVVIYPRLKNLQPVGSSAEYPYVLCTSALTEHWGGGCITRNNPWINELMPEVFAEISEELAEKLNVYNGERIKLRTSRDEIDVIAMATKRIHPLNVNGKTVEVIWVPQHWGFQTLSPAWSANLLTIDVGDPNTWIQETKACLCDAKKA